jgi:hypothetical protein
MLLCVAGDIVLDLSEDCSAFVFQFKQYNNKHRLCREPENLDLQKQCCENLAASISFIDCSKSAWYSWIYFCSVAAFYIVAVNFCNTDFLYTSLQVMRMFKIQFPRKMLIKLTNTENKFQHCRFAMVGLRRELSYAHSLKLYYRHMWLLDQAFPFLFFLSFF